MRTKLLMGVGAALAVVAPFTVPAGWAQQTPDNTAFLNETINNKGLPHQAPSIGLPAIYGLNPCATGAAAGVTTPLFGISGAISNIDRECETRNNAAVAVTAIKDEAVAREIMCNVKDFREASLRVGKPCLIDQRRPVAAAPAGAPVAAAASAVPTPIAAAVAPAAPPAPAAAPATPALLRDAPAFCHRPDLDLALYPDCTSRSAQPSTRADAADQGRTAPWPYYRYGRTHRGLRREALTPPLPEASAPLSSAFQSAAPTAADANAPAARYVGVYTRRPDGQRVFSLTDRAALEHQSDPSQNGGE
ncbi:MAG: hypothetical protein JO157_18570 [Acetobacteraceae bacterium]|nr:hypothetical protein [Acetobacteraceae bacterium]